MLDPKVSSQFDRLEALKEINHLLDTADNEHRSFISALELVTKLTQASRGHLLLVKDQGAVTEVVASQQPDGETNGDGLSTAGRLILDQVLQTGESRRIEATATGEPRTHLVVPLLVRDKILGAVYLESIKDNAFLSTDLFFAELAAKLIAMTIEQRSLKADIQEAKLAKYRYVSSVTHELRVPLTSIAGYTDMLVTGMVGELSERQEFFLQTVKRNVVRMGKLIASLSDINRIESGRMKIQLSDFDIAILLEEIAAKLEETFAERDQQLSFEVALELPPVHADRALISQVLASIINNASLYSPEGSAVEVTVIESGAFAQAKVTDKGIGISEADQSQLFTPFFRSEDEKVRQHVGWGLDLAVAQKFVRALGGDISCHSELGVGSIFTITLPLTLGEPNSVE